MQEATTTYRFLENLGIESENRGGFDGEWIGSGPEQEVTTPIDGSVIATVHQVTEEEYERIVGRAHEAFLEWRKVPAPRRGEIVRQIGDRLRDVKHDLGQLVTHRFDLDQIEEAYPLFSNQEDGVLKVAITPD